MILEEGLEVEVVSQDKTLVEFDKAGSGKTADSNVYERYIEAPSGAEFSIKVIAKKGFHLHGANSLKIRVEIDGGTIYIAKNFRFQTSILSSDVLLRTSTLILKESNRFEEKGQWLKYSLKFKETEIGKNSCFTLIKQDKLTASRRESSTQSGRVTPTHRSCWDDKSVGVALHIPNSQASVDPWTWRPCTKTGFAQESYPKWHQSCFFVRLNIPIPSFV